MDRKARLKIARNLLASCLANLNCGARTQLRIIVLDSKITVIGPRDIVIGMVRDRSWDQAGFKWDFKSINPALRNLTINITDLEGELG